MPDHLHWVFQLGEDHDLPTVMRLFKGRSAKNVNKALMRRGPVWQRAYFDHAIRHYEEYPGYYRDICGKSLAFRIGCKHWKIIRCGDAIWLNIKMAG